MGYRATAVHLMAIEASNEDWKWCLNALEEKLFKFVGLKDFVLDPSPKSAADSFSERRNPYLEPELDPQSRKEKLHGFVDRA